MDKKITYRYERKYMLDVRDYFLLRSRISAVLPKDDHAKENNVYHIRSLYFDDMKNTDLFTKISGIENRKKYRLRYYNNDPSFIRMEKKVKHNEVSYKRSAKISLNEAFAMSKGSFNFLKDSEDPLLREIYLYNRMNILRPSVITDYDREAYTLIPGNVRITFDTNLRTGLLNTDVFDMTMPLYPALPLGSYILEVKYDNFLPSIVADLLRPVDPLSTPISKFTHCKKFISLNDWEVL